MKRTISTAFVAALLMPLSATAQAPQMMRIGAAGAVAGRVQALSAASAAVGRVIESGQPLYLNDKITTDAQGRLQVLLQDETVFTIGPNSAMVLDEFVYNPSNGAGKVTARILKGVFRFVSGVIARKRPDDMSIKTPVGVIGIRGTIGGGEVNDDGGTFFLFGPKEGNNAGNRKGQFKLTSNNGKSQDILQPGFGAHMKKDGVDKPFKVPKGQLDAFFNSLNGNPPPSGKGQGGKAGDTKGFKGGKESGQDTGKGLESLKDTSDVNGAFEDTSNTVNGIINTFSQLADGPSTWDQVRTIETGTGVYSGSGVFTQTQCSFIACNFQGTTSLTMNVDFGARQITSGTVMINTTGAPFGGAIVDTSTFQSVPISYASLNGTATFSPTIGTSGQYSGSSVTLLNQNGVVAGAAKANIQYSFLGNVGSGTIVAPK